MRSRSGSQHRKPLGIHSAVERGWGVVRWKMVLFVAAGLFLLTVGATEAAAVCYFNGVAYPTGATVGPYTCMQDGSWRR